MEQNAKALMGMSVKAMIFHDGRLLLLQKNDAEELHHWEFPGGGLGLKEDFLTGLRREVLEETGLDIHILAPAGVWSYEKKNGQFLNGLIFAAAAHTDIVRLSEEHVDYRWILPQEVPNYRLHGSLWRSLLQMKDFDYSKSQHLLDEFLAACRRENE
ncbi:MAG: NUDIX hydrolase [Megasphaera sp.]|jgi:8-oxo-dGTP diphosphatase|nr:NUDIX hydrolase [Megasphaera sp.]MCH4188293.1 NUDIX hydrolase [Megasphaera sp.]MCH4218408.1 NUDIX hydrolase [Megasphaera sp.]